MAKIVPFRGIRYDLSKIGDPAAVMAPPYDVISPGLQEELYRRSQHNIVRLILGKTSPADAEGSDRYSRAAADFRAWLDQGVLVRDEEPSIYLYDQEYVAEGIGTVVRSGFIALARLEDFSSGVVKPHEKTLSGPKTDRLKLTRACRANFSPIFGLYSDPCCAVESLSRNERKRTPEFEIVDGEGVCHRFWQVTDAAVIGKAQDLLDNKSVFIADGHHRYETALNFRDEMRAQHPDFSGKELFNYVLMYFANMEDQGMLIFPTHRLIHDLEHWDSTSFLKAAKEYFEVEERPIDPRAVESRQRVRETLVSLGEKGHVFALFAGGGAIYYLTLKDEGIMDRFADGGSSRALRTLDVTILHRLILEQTLKITAEDQERQTYLRYVKNFDEPFDLVLAGDCQAAFLMNPTRMAEVRDVANAGEKMPQKSTYFYPKLLSGLVINPIAAGETVPS